MDRRSLVIIVLCVLVFVFYKQILGLFGLGRYLEPARPPAQGRPGAAAPPRDSAGNATNARASAPAPPPALRATPPAASMARSYSVDTPLYHAELSNLGARLVSVELKRFESAYGVSGARLDQPAGARRPRGGGREARDGEVPPGDRVALAGGPTFELELGSGASRRSLADLAYAVAESTDAAGAIRALTFTAHDPGGTWVRQTYRFRPDRYAVDLEVEIRGVPESARISDYSLALRSWPTFTEADRLSDERALRASSLVGTNIHRDHAQGLKKQPKSYEGNVGWAGVQSRYFLAAAAIRQGTGRGAFASAEERAIPELVGLGGSGARQGRAVEDVVMNRVVMSLPSASQPVHRFVLYVGPSEYAELDRLTGTQLERAVDLGWNWIRPISAVLLRVLNWIHALLRNYGVAIIVLATLLRVLLHPLNMAGMKSMRAMQRLQPEIERLRQKYKNDAQTMNTAIMALYRENKVNPAGGCLPMLMQMPVLVALYQVLFNAIELRRAPFISWMSDLSAPELLFSVAGFPIRLLPILMAGSGFLLQRMTPTSKEQAPTAYMMNLLMLVFFYNLPSGLVLYWTVMNLLSAVQQWLVLRSDGPPLQGSKA